ncbi:MAG TPA: C25 family cysteine peptidase [Burkholderiaceae bacterium]|nr:C25 family cysteine peptidase [Burkholderiaceae bacterium]
MFQLLIVCPKDSAFISACTDYAQFKRASGVTCLVLPFDSNLERQRMEKLPFLKQQRIDPNLLTEPAACLKVDLFGYYLTKNTRYVMLTGDVDKLPTPWFEFSQSGNRYFYPTDLYYADLLKRSPKRIFQSWDPDRDSVKGEFQADQISAIDFTPDLAIGRIPASSAVELRRTFARLMSRQPRVPRCLLLRGNADASTQWLEAVATAAADRLASRGYAVTRMSIDPAANSSTAQGVLNQLNAYLADGCEYIFWFGHGGKNSWSRFGPYSLQFSTLVPLTSGSPIVFSMSCEVGQFNRGVYDTPYLSSGVLTSPPSQGGPQTPLVPDSLQPKPSTMDADFGPEEWTVKHAQGATALIAGHSWGTILASGTPGEDYLSSQPLDFIAGLPRPDPTGDPNLEMQNRTVGDAFNSMLFSYLARFKQTLPTEEGALNHLLRMNLFGDPTTPLFT